MNYKIMSRSTCERYALQRHKDSSIIISIRSSFDRIKPNLPQTDDNNIKDVLFVQFDDIDELDTVRFGSKKGLIDNETATNIAKFVEKYKDNVNIIICHCDGGISRSAGVIAALMRFYEKTDSKVFRNRNKHPNMFVYLKMLDVLKTIDLK